MVDGRIRRTSTVAIRKVGVTIDGDDAWTVSLGFTDPDGVRMQLEAGGLVMASRSEGEFDPLLLIDQRVVQGLVDTAWAQGVRPAECRCDEQGTMEIIAGMGLKAGQPVYAYGDDDSVRQEMEAKNREIESLKGSRRERVATGVLCSAVRSDLGSRLWGILIEKHGDLEPDGMARLMDQRLASSSVRLADALIAELDAQQNGGGS